MWRIALDCARLNFTTMAHVPNSQLTGLCVQGVPFVWRVALDCGCSLVVQHAMQLLLQVYVRGSHTNWKASQIFIR